MDQKNTVKPLTESGKSVLDRPCHMMAAKQEIFFSFVDKNPLFANNSREAIHDYLLTSSQRQSGFKPHFDGDGDQMTHHLPRNRFRYRYK